MYPALRVCMKSALALLPVFLPFLPTIAFASATINVISPRSGSSSGSAVFYEASATTSCPQGISAMRIYSAPYVIAYTVGGAHLETFITLKAGSYKTVVQAWDNCGGVTKTPVAITVSSAAQVSVFLPSSAGSYNPVHFAASAQNPDCPAGIAAMRIYTAWGVTPYTVDSNQLDAYVVLRAQTYFATVQAWDNCGNVLKTNFQVQSAGGDADAYLYSNSQSGVISQFEVLYNGHLANPNGSGNPPQFRSGVGANTLSIDAGGWFAYTAAQNGVFGYQINPTNGALTPTPNSPFSHLSSPTFAFVDPTGNFVFAIFAGSTSIASLQIDRSSGDLSQTASLSPGGTLTALTTDPYGKYLYAATNSGQILGFKINPDSGILTAVPGSPFSVPGSTYAFALSAAYQYLYVGELASAGQQIDAYQIQYNSGTLTPAPGNPYSAPNTLLNDQAVLADWLTRYLWTGKQDPVNGSNSFWQFDIDGYTGGMGSATDIDAGPLYVDYLTEGHSANLVYTAGDTCGPMTCVPSTVNSWTINGSGLLEHLSGPLETGTQIPTGVAVERQNPQ
jgi:hypothetical protein